MKSKTVKNVLVYGVAVLVLAGLFLATQFYVTQRQNAQAKTLEEVAAQTKVEAETRLAKIKVVEILPVPFTDILVLPGTVVAHQEIELASKMAGVVEWIGPKEGNRVKKGERLLQIDMKSVETMVTEAQARYDLALKDFTRTEKLYEEKIMSKRQYDSAKANLDMAQAALDSATVHLSDSTLNSPISGILDRLNIDPGEYINPGQTVMTIVDIDRVDIELPIPEKDILYFKKGQKVRITMSQSGQEDCEKNADHTDQTECRVFQGTIDFIPLTADGAARTYTIKVGVNNSKHTLRPGMIVRAHLVRRQMKDAIAVPFFTIVDHESGKSVFVVEEDKAVEKPIKYGAFQEGLVEVRKGLKLGERLIIVGQRSLVDGQKVDVTGDITPLARQWIQEGRDLSELSIDILQ
jgi:membrane fusion protein (multidrug efflux system)